MKKILFLFFVVFLSFSSQASHFIGGEITWECDKDPLSPNYGKYTFYMTIYQDCDGIDFSTTGYNIDVHNHPSLFSINPESIYFGIRGCSNDFNISVLLSLSKFVTLLI